jgi:hypothetical protein
MTTTTPTKPATRTSRANRAAAQNAKTTPAAKPATPADASDLTALLKGSLAQAKGTNVVAITSAGKSATGDNGHGHHTATPATTKPATPAKTGRKTPTKPAASAKTGRKPATPTATPATKVRLVKERAPSKTPARQLVATLLVKAGADLAAKWTTAKLTEVISQEEATAMINKYLSYLPECEWDARLPEREHPGGRGLKRTA